MRSPSSFETLEPRQSLDRAQCAAIGERLAAARNARGLTVDDVGRTLLLSPRQVRALESFEAQAFHNVSFYLNALRKYAAFCGLDEGLVARLETTRVEPPPRVERAVVPIEDTGESLRRKGMISAAIVALIVVSGAAWSLSRSRAASPATTTAVANPAPTPPPTADVATPAVVPAPIPPMEPAVPPGPVEPVTTPEPTPEESAVAPTDLGGGEPTIPEPQELAPVLTPTTRYGSFRANQKAWMFLRQSDNSVIERTLAPGEVVQLRTKPRYLALGTGEVEVTIGDVSVDTTKFIRNGTLRMGVAEFTTAEESAVITPASEPQVEPTVR